MNVYLGNTIRFVVLVLVQIFILNNLYLHSFVVPILYLYFVIKLPFKTSNVLVLLLAFLMGITIDLFTGTPGLNAASCTAVAFLRPTFVKIVLPKLNKDSNINPSVTDMGLLNFLAYASLLIIAHSFLLIFLEVFSFQYFGRTLLCALLTALVSILMVICCELFFRLWHHNK